MFIPQRVWLRQIFKKYFLKVIVARQETRKERGSDMQHRSPAGNQAVDVEVHRVHRDRFVFKGTTTRCQKIQKNRDTNPSL